MPLIQPDQKVKRIAKYNADRVRDNDQERERRMNRNGCMGILAGCGRPLEFRDRQAPRKVR